jgi:hypothetical protein
VIPISERDDVLAPAAEDCLPLEVQVAGLTVVVVDCRRDRDVAADADVVTRAREHTPPGLAQAGGERALAQLRVDIREAEPALQEEPAGSLRVEGQRARETAEGERDSLLLLDPTVRLNAQQDLVAQSPPELEGPGERALALPALAVEVAIDACGAVSAAVTQSDLPGRHVVI